MAFTVTGEPRVIPICTYFLFFLHPCLAGVINRTSVKYTTRPIVINEVYSSGIQKQIILNLIDKAGRCDGKLHLSLSALGLDVFSQNNSSVEIDDVALSHVNCIYSLSILPSTLSGEMFGGTDNSSRNSGQLSMCEDGIRGYVNLPFITPFPHGAVLWIRPDASRPSNLEKKPATVHQTARLHRVTVVATASYPHPSGFSIAPRLPSTIPFSDASATTGIVDKHSVHKLMQGAGETLRRQKRSGNPNEESQTAPEPAQVYYQPNYPEGLHIVELYMIVDEALAREYQGDYDLLVQRVNEIVRLVNEFYVRFNILIVIVRLEIWEQDQTNLNVQNYQLTYLAEFKRQHAYAIRHDCLHALLGMQRRDSLKRGDAEQQSLCSYSNCVGYTRDSRRIDTTETARTMAHELGHNFGLTHDTEECQCQSCVMATGVEFERNLQEWSPCSVRDMKLLLEHGMGSCLHDRPRPGQVVMKTNPVAHASSTGYDRQTVPSVVKVYTGKREVADPRYYRRHASQTEGQLCGNGQLDPGEECDCGTSNSCPVELQSCCDTSRCRLKLGAQCAGGPCCAVTPLDQYTYNGKPRYQCRLKPSGTVCRSVYGSCDLPEYCNGTSQWCPADVYKADGVVCQTEKGHYSYCIRGGCREGHGWCRELWGHTAERGSERCFEANWNLLSNHVHSVANCGKQRPTPAERWSKVDAWPGIACSSKLDAQCGRLWCHHRNEKPMKLGWKQSENRSLHNGDVCGALVYDPTWPVSDPLMNNYSGMLPTAAGFGQYSMVTQDAGMVPDGTPCGRGLCYNGSCIDRLHPCSCTNGVCNNLGNCHCDVGFRPPNCDYGGDGGSIDSGPPPTSTPSNPDLIIVLCVLAVILIPIVILGVYWWKRTGRVFPSSIKCTIAMTETGLASPFHEGIVACLCRCFRKRIWKTDHIPKPSGSDNFQSLDASPSGGGSKNGHIGGKPAYVPLVATAQLEAPSTGWTKGCELSQKPNNHITNSSNNHKNNSNSRLLDKDDLNSRTISSTGLSRAGIKNTHSSSMKAASPVTNGHVIREVNNGILAVSKSQPPPQMAQLGRQHMRKQDDDAAESRLQSLPNRFGQCDNNTGPEARPGDAPIDIPLISEPHLKTMTYHGKLCALPNAAKFAQHRGC